METAPGMNMFKLNISELLQFGECGDAEETPLDFYDHKLRNMSWAWFEEFQKNGQTTPVLVGNMGGGVWRLMNGHHRLVAAMLLGWDYLWAVDEADDEDPDRVWASTDSGWQCRNIDFEDSLLFSLGEQN